MAISWYPMAKEVLTQKIPSGMSSGFLRLKSNLVFHLLLQWEQISAGILFLLPLLTNCLDNPIFIFKLTSIIFCNRLLLVEDEVTFVQGWKNFEICNFSTCPPNQNVGSIAHFQFMQIFFFNFPCFYCPILNYIRQSLY